MPYGREVDPDVKQCDASLASDLSCAQPISHRSSRRLLDFGERGYGGRWFARMFIALMLLLTTACGTTSVIQRPGRATAEPPISLPSFSDWRVAYLGADSQLRIVTLDARTVLAGPKLSGVAINGLRIASAGFSRNGHLFAYSGKSGIQVLDVSGRQNTNHVAGVAAAEVAWSPDGTELALGDGQGSVGIARVVDGAYRTMPSQRDHILDGILGWVDNTHLAVTLVPPPAAAIPSEPRTALGILDTSTWSLHTVATFSSAAMGDMHCTSIENSAMIPILQH